MSLRSNLITAALVATVWMPMGAVSQRVPHPGYLVESQSEGIVMSGSGLCWHVSDWTPARMAAPCGPVKPQVAILAPMQPPVMVAAAPAMPAEPVPTKPVSERLSLSGDALFGFDRHELTVEGKSMLDELVRRFDGATFHSVTVTGHTDRLGSQAYNQPLSERRAAAVKAHLVGLGVDAAGIGTRGMGKSQPATGAGACPGARSVAVIACLQPDRRVEVEMTGSREVSGALSSR